eukprot:1162123-Pelagomonas_calceolata.AAC.7
MMYLRELVLIILGQAWHGLTRGARAVVSLMCLPNIDWFPKQLAAELKQEGGMYMFAVIPEPFPTQT